MAFLHCDYFSKTLLMNTSLNVVIPTPDSEELIDKGEPDYFAPGTKYQVLYLLHGLYGDCTDWQRLTGIERYAQRRKVAVVMPSASNSFYHDMAHGGRFLSFMTEELPRFAQAMFPVSAKREDSFVAGLSMGGYGALKLALSRPELFSCAASLSGAVDIVGLVSSDKPRAVGFEDIFGPADKVAGGGADLFALAARAKESRAGAPRLFMSCGTEDSLLGGNRKAKAVFEGLGLDLRYEEHPGAHSWEYWDEHIRRVLDWLPLAGRPLA